ncbi:amino acid aminotransferase [Pseudaeromonas pectinilytica]|jgi:Aspartate/tyrosine/aromatic aminotransferase|nr:aspartate/tyrosine/aromatic aminotransferase [Aeromonadaceae bacterium]
MFEQVTAAPADPILGLTDEFRNDARSHKINLGVGIYKNDAGDTPILSCVKKAEQILLDTEKTKNYLSIEGNAEYGQLVQHLLFGADHEIVTSKRARTAQAPGGTGALRIGAEFLSRQKLSRKVWISNPTWVNHFQVFGAAGLETGEYTYYNPATRGLDFDAMLQSLSQAQAGDVVLLHGCCHNPTGIDPTLEQWEVLAKFCAERQLLPFFDFAYQGFSRGVDEDAAGLRLFARFNRELLVASSFSKNFGLYNERVGAITLVTEAEAVANVAFSQVKAAIRANYSNPPAHGAAVVTTVLKDAALKQEWIAEVTQMRDRIWQMRELFVAKLKEQGVQQDFSFMTEQNGMFSFSGLNKDQVARLKNEFAVYIVGSGRISVAGITSGNIDALCQAIAKVL